MEKTVFDGYKRLGVTGATAAGILYKLQLMPETQRIYAIACIAAMVICYDLSQGRLDEQKLLFGDKGKK